MARLLNLLPWRRRRLERDLDRELRYHIDRRVEDLTRSGMSEAEARRRARLELGGLAQVREGVRDTWIARWIDNLGRDLRYAGRMLLRHPGFTATAMISLALGIGANAAIFSLVDRVLLRPLPVSEPEHLVQLRWRGPSLSSTWGVGSLMSYPLCRDLQEQDRFFDGVFCRHPTNVTFSTGRQHQPVAAEIVSGSYFPVLGVHPEIGRLIDPSDDRQPGAHPVVVLSYAYWKNALGGAPDVVGLTVLVNSHPMTVIGVAAAGFVGVDPLEAPSVWIPAMMKRQATPEWDRLLDRRSAWMHVFARLKPGMTPDRVEAGLQPWFTSAVDAESRLEGFPRVSADVRDRFLASTIGATPVPRGLSWRRGALERPLWVLSAGTLLLLLLAALNVAGLLLARGAARGRELTTRMALGASRTRLASQLIAESVLMTVVGGWLGLLAAPAVSGMLLSFLSQDLELGTAIDGRVFLFAFAVTLITGVCCGLAPALQARGRSLISAIKADSNVGPGSAIRVRKTIVIAQMAFTLVLLIGAGLFVQTLARLHAKDRGFASDGLLMFYLEPDAIGYSEADAPRLMRDVLHKVQDVPAVERAAIANNMLLSGGGPRRILTIQSDRRLVTDNAVPMMRVGPGFFATLGTPLVAGREFTDADTIGLEQSGFRSIIVNESFVRRYFDGRSPIGRRVGIGNQPDTRTTIEIVGVIRDFTLRFVRDDEEPEHVFFPFAQAGALAGNGAFYLKIRGDAASAFPAVRAAVGEVDARLPLIRMTTLADQVENSLGTERMLATLSSGFGAVALLLSVVGLYGVMSFVVTRRTREIGLRLALGATRTHAMWLVVRDALIMIAAGTLIALPAAWALRRLVQAQLFGVGVFHGPTIALAAALLATVALAAAMLPAWRAASVSPTEALRVD